MSQIGVREKQDKVTLTFIAILSYSAGFQMRPKPLVAQSKWLRK